MIEVLAQISNVTWGLIAVAVVALGANIAFARKVLNSLNADPLDERKPAMPSPLADAVESKPAESLRTKVAAPRPRRLQPPSDTPAASSIPEVAAPPRPVKLGAPSVKETELAEPVLASALTIRKEEKPADVPLKGETPIPVGALIAGSLDAGIKGPVVPPGPAVETKESAAPLSLDKALPPLSPAAKPNEAPVPGRKFFEPALPTASLAGPVNPPPSRDESKKGVVLPHLFASTPAPDRGKKALGEPATGPKAGPGIESKSSADLTVLKSGEPAPATPAPKSETPKIEQTGDGLLAVGGPAKGDGGPALPPISAEEADDVKKKTPRTPVPEPAVSAGLILIPPAESKPEPVAAKLAEKPAEPAAVKPGDTPAEPAVAKVEEKPAEPAVKLEAKPAAEKAVPEPVLSPAVADILPASKPEVETKSIKGPRVFLPGKFFGRGNKEKEPAAETKTAKEAADKAATPPAEPAKVEAELPKITTPDSAPALVVPPVEEIPAVAEAKKDASAAEPAAKVEEPKTPEPAAKKSEPSEPEPVKPAIEPAADKTLEKPAAESAPVAKPVEPAPEAKPAPEKPAAKAEPAPEPKPAAPVEEKPVSVVRSFFSREKTPAAPAKPAPAPIDSLLPTQSAPTVEPIAEPLVPIITPAPAPETAPVTAQAETPASSEAPITPAPAASIIQPQSVMPPNDTTTSLPNNGRASAQLTIGFEITSLQLTPFFKLGSVQLKALSNVVSLHLVATQAADSPLAAGISFQIEHVDLDGASHLKSILLKPLGESRAITAPVSKLQVDNVAVTGGGDGSPISVTTSDQASTAVQLFGTFTIAAMDFTPAFEIGSLRLEPTSNTVLLRVAPSSRPTALDLPPSFEVAAVQLGDGAQITGVRLTPSGAK